MDILKIQCNLADWFRSSGRKLPWRDTTSPYAVAVSEFMLQQTRVSAVIPYFLRWMEAFPSVDALAAASEHDVLALWQGLGYYSRARNLHHFARQVSRLFSGEIPSDEQKLLLLPGIGPYTAAAIRAFSFDLPAPVVDANIARVLARLFDFREPIDTAAGKEFLFLSSMTLQAGFPSPRIWNSALMDLGATLCTSQKPACLICPLKPFCQTPTPALLPQKKPKPEITRITENRAFCFARNQIWLEQSAGPRWKGLWILPELETLPSAPPIASLDYPITRYQVTMQIFASAPLSELIAHSLEEFEKLPVASPHRRAVALCLRFVHTSDHV